MNEKKNLTTEETFALAVQNHQKNNLQVAENLFKRILDIEPDHVKSIFYLGSLSVQTRNFDRAKQLLNKTIQINPNHTKAHNNLGIVFQELGEPQKAISCYEKAIEINPNYAGAYSNLGAVFNELGDHKKAISCCEKAIEINPNYADAYNNLGVVFNELGDHKKAISCCEKAIQIQPNYAEAHNNLGVTLQEQGKLDEAVRSYARALQVKPDYDFALAQKLHQQAHMCDWHAIAEFEQVQKTLGIMGEAVSTFSLLSREDSPVRQRLRSENWARQNYKNVQTPLPAKPVQKPTKLRIGYFSADFHDHPTLRLMSGVLAAHDSSRFEIYAYSYGATRHGEIREQLAKQVDKFSDILGVTNLDVVTQARAHGLDIAVDLKGYTQNTRSELFAYRLAPIQINYLGYPSTMGADFIDYIVADATVIPEEQREHYSESIIYLPHSYQPNDNTRKIADSTITRADFSLPEDVFVFCCFNNNYKLSPREFDIWMRLLQKVDGSVLWLLRSNRWAEDNLYKEAEARGVDASRIVFAEMTPHVEHLARLRLADLFVDTFNCNAHTMASEALWAGIPVVTKPGEQFAARVAASLLNAIGLHELIADTEEAYEALILELAINKGKMALVKQKLADNRLTQPLFSTELYTKHLESAYQQVYQRFFDGKPTDTIYVSDEGAY